MQNQPGMTGLDWALLVLLSILWGGSFFFAKVIVQEVPPFTLVFIRFACAAGALWVYLAVDRTALPSAVSTWMAFATMGALNNLIPVALIAWAQITIASGLASVLIATTPVFSILVAHCITADERISANKLVGIALGIAGVLALVGLNISEGSPGSILAVLGCLAAALSYGCANVFGRRFKRLGIAPTVGAFGQLAATAVMVAPVALVIDRPWRLPPPTVAVPGVDARPRSALDGPGIRHFLPAPRERRNDQCLFGDVAHSGQRDPARHLFLGRTPVCLSVCGDGSHRAWSGCHRWPRMGGDPPGHCAQDHPLMHEPGRSRPVASSDFGAYQFVHLSSGSAATGPRLPNHRLAVLLDSELSCCKLSDHQFPRRPRR